MKTREFFFDLPRDSIAQSPAETREGSRLLLLDRRQESIEHKTFSDLPELLPEKAVLVLNDSRVRKARIIAHTEHGGKVECLFLQPAGASAWRIIVNRSKKLHKGRVLHLPGEVTGVIEESKESKEHTRIIRTDRNIDELYFETYGHVPLPPYIRRADSDEDTRRYQTVYSGKPGSVAAPTAGLHFSKELLHSISEKGIILCCLTLHVGIGTFLPIRTDTVEQHTMHMEEYHIPIETAEIVNRSKAKGIPVIAVGTTSVRALESAWNNQGVSAGRNSTDLFIYPGFTFNVVDHLITNFHTPESSLLVMVSAFSGKKIILRAYKEAIKEGYRFFSYGDAMYIR